MKKNIITIVNNRRRVGRICRKIDDLILRIALDPFGNTAEQIARIQRLTLRRRAVACITTLYTVLSAPLMPEEKALLRSYCAGDSVCCIAAEYGISRTKAYKSLSAIFRKAADSLLGFGLDEDALTDYLRQCSL